MYEWCLLGYTESINKTISGQFFWGMAWLAVLVEAQLMDKKLFFVKNIWRLAFVAVLALVLALIGLQPGHVQAQEPAPLFVEAQAVGALDAPAEAIRSRLVNLDLSALNGPDGELGSQSLEGGLVVLNLFPDVTLTATIDRVEPSASGGKAWIGHIDGSQYSQVYMVLTNDGVFAAHVATLDALYQVNYAGPDVYNVSQIDQSRYGDDIVLTPSIADGNTPFVAPELGAQALTYIDVMVVYTANAATAAGGTSAMNSLIDLGITETNQSYINSNVNQRVNLVYKGQVAYSEGSNPDFGTVLDQVTNKTDGYIDNVHALRDQYKADLVSLWIQGSQYCGIAWLMDPPSSSFESHGFSVVAQSCATGYYSFAHEMGHNMGAEHDRGVAGTVGDGKYNYGYVNQSARWRTVMAYNTVCSNAGYNCTRIQYWSNPDALYNSAALGIASGNYAADNRRRLNDTAATVAAFRVNTGFNKSSPANGATGLGSSTTLTWGSSAGANHYEVCYDTSNDNLCAWTDNGIVAAPTTNKTISSLAAGTTYYWQVRACTGATWGLNCATYGDGASTAFWTFQTEPISLPLPGAFAKSIPVNSAVNVDYNNPSLIWNSSTDAASYEYCLYAAGGSCSYVSVGASTNVGLGLLTPATTYYWQVRARNATGTTEADGGTLYSFTTMAEVIVANDSFSSPVLIGALPYDSPELLDTRFATTAASDPTFPCGGGTEKSHSVWYKFTTGEVPDTFYVWTFGSDYDTVLAVWTGTESNLTNVACNDDSSSTVQSMVEVDSPQPNTDYYIEVVSWNTESAGWLSLHLAAEPPAPANDTFAGAIVVPSIAPYITTINVASATTDASDPDTCGGSQGSRSVWFEFTPAQTSTLFLSTYYSGYDTVIAVWQGSEGSLTSQTCNDDYSYPARGRVSGLTYQFIQGETYYIEVTHYYSDAAQAPAYDFSLTFQITTPNDDLDTAYAMTVPARATLTTSNFSLFVDDPDLTTCNRRAGLASAWFKFVAPSTGTLVVDTLGTDYDTILGVFSGDRTGYWQNNLTLLSCDDDSAGDVASRTVTSVTAGQTYYIVASQYYGSLDPLSGQDAKPAPIFSEKDSSEINAQAGGTLVLNTNWAGSLTYRSIAAQDGWVLESGEFTEKGGSANYGSTTFLVGDGLYDKQYRGILSFDTRSLPDNAVVLGAALQVKLQSVKGTNPFFTHGSLLYDMRTPYFGAGLGLTTADFQAGANYASAGSFNSTPSSGWYSAYIPSATFSAINKTNYTQFRLRYSRDDNEDRAMDALAFYSGNYGTLAWRPALVVQYYIPAP